HAGMSDPCPRMVGLGAESLDMIFEMINITSATGSQNRRQHTVSGRMDTNRTRIPDIGKTRQEE
ncbi:MAG TPA: hypothetical protein PLM00_09695, partial [Spirochaetota bacterium]|nr:hypothetical protein [Spirochaetota bacterium]